MEGVGTHRGPAPSDIPWPRTLDGLLQHERNHTMLTILILCAYMVLVPLGLIVVGRYSKRAEAFEQVRFSPWLANFDEYCRHALEEGFRPIGQDEDRTVYIRHVEFQRQRRARRPRS